MDTIRAQTETSEAHTRSFFGVTSHEQVGMFGGIRPDSPLCQLLLSLCGSYLEAILSHHRCVTARFVVTARS
jgi:hypothetical protein